MTKLAYIYGVIAIDGDDEGICGAKGGKPARFPNAETVDLARVRMMAQEFATKTGMSVIIAKFSQREDLETVVPVKTAGDADREAIRRAQEEEAAGD